MNNKPDCLSDDMRVVGPLTFRVFRLVAGREIIPHTHNFGHTTLVMVGTVEASIDKGDGTDPVTQRFTAPDAFAARAEWLHGMRAITDCEVWCAYPHRNADGEVVEEYSGFTGAYE